MSSILEGLYNEQDQPMDHAVAQHLRRKLEKVESILGRSTDRNGKQFNQAIQDITKNIKYLEQDELVFEIYSKMRSMAEAIGMDVAEGSPYDDEEDAVREAFNNLEAAVYNMEEPFEDYVRGLQTEVEEYELAEGMYAEDDLEEGQRCWKGYKKVGTKQKGGKTVNNCVKADESVEFDQGAFDEIFKDYKKKGARVQRKPKPYDNHPTKRSPQPYDKGPKTDQKLKEFQRGSFDDDKPKRPSKGKLVTKDGMPVTLPLRTQDFRGDEIVIVDYIPPHKPSSAGYILTDDGMTSYPGVAGLKIIGHQFDVDEGKKSSIGKVMEMYDDVLYLMYIDGKLAMPSPIEKKDMNKYERLILNVLPGSEVKFKGTPRHHYSAEELAEGKGAIRKTLAGILLLGGLLGLNNHQAQKVYDQSHQLQQLTQVYMVAKDRGDEAKMKDVKRRIGNHKMRLDLGKGDVDFDGRPGKDDIKDIDYINPIEEK